MSKLKWETIEQTSNSSDDIPREYRGEGRYYSFTTIKRCKVFGGWLVKSESGAFEEDNMGKSRGIGDSLTFVPDLKWEWVL